MKLLFSDIDGTLLNSNKTISKKLRSSIIEFIGQGNVFILCSGRPEQSIINLKEDLKLPDHHVFISSCNGSKLYDCEKKKTISETGIPLPLVRKILDAAYSFNLHCHTYDDSSILSEFQTKELEQYTRHVTIPVHVMTDVTTYMQKDAPKILAICFDEITPFSDFKKKIDEISNHTLTSLFSNSSYLEIFSKDAGKGSSVEKLAHYLSVPIENTIAVGDAQNDISMLKAAHIGVAMKNADQNTKDAADYITLEDNTNDGLIEVLTTFDS